MLVLDEIRDPERLRQVAVLLERENARLHTKLQILIAELARLRGEASPTAQDELHFLKELLAQRERALFGASSEQRSRPAVPAPSAPPPGLRPGHGPAAQPALPRIEVTHALAAADQACPQCGGRCARWPARRKTPRRSRSSSGGSSWPPIAARSTAARATAA